MPAQGLGVTGFFVNPVRKLRVVGSPWHTTPCTKEIKYNALKPIEDIPADLDQGDCYAEYLYWDDGAQSALGGPEMGMETRRRKRRGETDMTTNEFILVAGRDSTRRTERWAQTRQTHQRAGKPKKQWPSDGRLGI